MEVIRSRALNLVSEGLASNSRLTYSNAINAFDKFRRTYSLEQAWPAERQHIIMYISYCFESGLAPASIRTYIAGINYWHKLHNWPEVSSIFIVRKMLEGCARLRQSVDNRAPLTRGILIAIIEQLPFVCYNHYEVLLFSAAWTFAYFGLFRIGEIVLTSKSHPNYHLQLTDIALANDQQSVTVTLKHFKTLQRGEPITLKIPAEKQGLCPIKNLRKFLAVRHNTPGPLFCHANSASLTRSQLAAVLDKCLKRTNFRHLHYRTHSFRIGRATDLAASGISGDTIMKLGRWKSTAYKGYVR